MNQQQNITTRRTPQTTDQEETAPATTEGILSQAEGFANAARDWNAKCKRSGEAEKELTRRRQESGE